MAFPPSQLKLRIFSPRDKDVAFMQFWDRREALKRFVWQLLFLLFFFPMEL